MCQLGTVPIDTQKLVKQTCPPAIHCYLQRAYAEKTAAVQNQAGKKKGSIGLKLNDKERVQETGKTKDTTGYQRELRGFEKVKAYEKTNI